MRRLSKFWTGVGTAAVVCLGTGLGGVGLVDFDTMLAIAMLPQPAFLIWGQWPELASVA